MRPKFLFCHRLSNELLMLPFFLIIETKWRKDNRDFLFVSITFSEVCCFFPGIIYILEIALFVSALVSFIAHPQIFTEGSGAQTPLERGQAHQ